MCDAHWRANHPIEAGYEQQMNFSRPAFSSKDDGDKRTMAATAGEGTAPKLGSGKCAGSTSASNSRVRCDVTGGRDPTTFQDVKSNIETKEYRKVQRERASSTKEIPEEATEVDRKGEGETRMQNMSRDSSSLPSISSSRSEQEIVRDKQRSSSENESREDHRRNKKVRSFVRELPRQTSLERTSEIGETATKTTNKTKI